MSLRMLLLSVLIFAISFTALVIWQMMDDKIPEPKYSIVQSDGAMEIRAYPEVIVAEVEVKGDRYRAINEGVHVLADYVFGNNKFHSRMPIPSPDMHAPVMAMQHGQSWIIRYVMPDTYNHETAPMPSNQNVKIIALPALKYAVIKFSGWNSDRNFARHLVMLQEYADKHSLHVTGEPVLVLYNPSWILPFLRRNEILLELKQD